MAAATIKTTTIRTRLMVVFLCFVLVRELSSLNEKTCTGVRLVFMASVPNLFNGK